MLLALLLAGAPLAVAAPQPGPVPADPVEKSVSIGPRDEWVDAALELSAGDRLVLSPTGRASFGEMSWGPEGTDPADFETMPLPGEPLGAVVGRIGEDVFMVGAGFDRAVATGGRLELSLNLPRGEQLDQLPGMQGGFRVAVAVEPVPPPPPDPIVNETGPAEPLANETGPAEPLANEAVQAEPSPAPSTKNAPSAAPVDEPDSSPAIPWMWIAAAAAAAAVLVLGVFQGRRVRLQRRTRARLSTRQLLETEPAGTAPPELSAAWPAVGTRWRVEEREPVFGGWSGKESNDE